MSSVSRRRFLGQSMATGSALVGATFFHNQVSLRADEKKPSANDTLGVMVVGCGGRGVGSHIPEFLKESRVKIIYLCDPDPKYLEKAAALVEKAQGFRPKTVLDMRDAFADKNLDVVSCASANHWHALCGVWAMQAGKDVYLEKPISHNIHEGKALIAAAKKYGRMCQVGSQCRSNPAMQNGFAFLRAGGIGEINLTRGLCYKRRKSIGALGQYPVPDGIDYNLWSGPAPMVDPVTRPEFHYDWHWQRLFGNGDSGNQGPHQTDIARTALGVNDLPESVLAYGGRLGYQAERKDPNYIDAGDTANTEVAIYNFPGGKTLVFETRGLSSESYRGAKVGVVAYGSEGFWVQVTYSLSIAYDKTGKEIKRFEGGKDSFHFKNFVDACLSRDYSSLNADARCGHLSASLAHMANISYYLGEKNLVSDEEAMHVLNEVQGNDDNIETYNRTKDHLVKNGVDLEKTPICMGPLLKFDPQTEHFTNNDEANKMESRDYRGEFVVPDADKV